MLTVLTVAGWVPTSALAQAPATQSPRPFQGMFGGSMTEPDPSVVHSLDVSASVVAAYDDNMLADFGGGTVQPSSLLQESGFYNGLSADLAYSWQGKRVQVGANASAGGRYYPDAGEYLSVNRSAGIGFAAQFARRTRMLVNQSFSYSPAYFYGLFPDLAPVTAGSIIGTGDPLGDQKVLVYDTSATLSHGITRHSDIEAVVRHRYSDFDSPGTLTKNLRSYDVGGRYRYNLSRDAVLRLGYVYRSGGWGYTQAALDRSIAVHDIDVGVDYRKSLSVSRRTTVDFGVGPAIVSTPVGGSTDSTLSYRVTGNVALNHQFSRTWRTSVVYNRGVGFTEGFFQPVYSDAVNASLSGFFSRRVDFNAVAGFAVGNEALSADANSFHAYSASARARMALGRRWAMVGEYQFYNHDLGETLLTPTGLPNQMSRNTVSVGLTFWFPLARR